MQKVKRVIEAGEIGKPFWARVSFRSGFEVFKAQPYLAEGKRFIIEDLGIHALDIARFLLGDAQNINARIKRVDPDIKGEDVATMLLDHGDGITSIVDCSYATKLETEPFPETLIEIDGDKGTLRLQQGYQMVVTSKQNGTRNEDLSPSVLPWAERPWHNIQESVSAIQQHWADCLQSGTEPQTSGRDNLQTLALVEAAYRSAATGETVKITDILA